MTPLFVIAEFRCTESGDAELRKHLERTLAEVRAVPGCLHATVWERPAERGYRFVTAWSDGEAVGRWVENEFHRTVLMPGFRAWCREGWFGELSLAADHDRVRKCPACGRWTAAQPGWSEEGPVRCRACDAALTGEEG